MTAMRKLVSGRTVDELPYPTNLTISTKCPSKWLFVDLENGNVWHVNEKVLPTDMNYPRWRAPTKAEWKGLKAVAMIKRHPEDVYPEPKKKGSGHARARREMG
jgi:hypothetical protein